MRLGLPDRTWALVVACALLGAAAFIVFVTHPGGFEGQAGWFLALMPGAFMGAMIGDKVFQVSPILERVLYWSVLLGATFLWYFGLSYAAIKACRLLARTFHR
jgi:hypothetical protein